jgi:putative addiction module component (TIGR02574 family)
MDIKNIPVAKRILLAQEIWDSIEDKQEIELSDEIKVELDNRIERHNSGKGKYYDLEESRARNAKLRNGL